MDCVKNQYRKMFSEETRLFIRRGIYRTFYKLFFWIRFPCRAKEEKVAIVKVDKLGDFVLAIGVVQHIISQYGLDKCEIILSKNAVQLCNREFPKLKQIVVEEHFSNTVEAGIYLIRLRQKKAFGSGYSKVVSVKHRRTAYYDMLLHSIPKRHLIGVDHSALHDASVGCSLLRFTDPIKIPKASESGPLEFWYHRLLLSGLPASSDIEGGEVPRIVPKQNGLNSAFEKAILVAPFTSTPIRDLSPKFVQEVLNSAKCAENRDVLLVAAPADSLRLEEFASQLNLNGPYRLRKIVPIDVEQLIEVLSVVAVVFSPETATAHLAVALSTPSVVVIGGGHFGQFGPWKGRGASLWITNHLECFNCNWVCRKSEPYCISGVSSLYAARCLDEVCYQ